MSADYQLLRERIERLYNELLVIEQQLHPLVTRLRAVLGEFLGATAAPPTPTPPAVPKEEGPRIIIPAEEVPGVPAPVRRAATLNDVYTVLNDILSEFRKGILFRRYTRFFPTTAPNPITFEGSDYDLGADYDAAIIVPSIDAQIRINEPVQPDTPVIFANTALNLDNMIIRKIYYKGIVPNLTGTLYVFAFKF
ncbi:MAG: hypothetical protein QXP81_09840 [Nitrososphaerota archaeon]